MGVKVREKIKGSGDWYVYINHNGERTARRAGTKPLARQLAENIQRKILLGDMAPAPPSITFRTLADHWITAVVPARCKASTTREYRAILKNYILPEFGGLPCEEVTRAKIRDFLLKQERSRSTVGHMKAVISGVMNEALEQAIVEVNPALQLQRLFPRKKRQREAVAPLTADELRYFLDTAKTGFPCDFPLLLFLARTGARIGEAVALQWDDINWQSGYATIERSANRGKVDTTKSGHSRRVDLSPQVIATLEPQKGKGIVFRDQVGGMLNPDNWRQRNFSRILEASGLRKFRIHDLRHTYATLRIAKGDNIADVSHQLGHHSVAFTLNIYYHWLPGGKKSEVSGLDSL